jgi:hypothetical protein
MSLLILGGDRINPILNILEELGVSDIIHWTARNQKNGRKKAKKIPNKVDMILMLTNFLNHNAMSYYRTEAKAKDLPIIYSTRNVNCVKSAFIQALAKLDSDSKICKSCDEYQRCYGSNK